MPLPVRGLFHEAKSAEIAGAFAGELHEWISDGFSLVTRPQSYVVSSATAGFQRLPFEFAAFDQELTISPTQITDGTLSRSGTFADFVSSASISSQEIIVGGSELLTYNGSAFTVAGFTTTTGVNPNTFDGVTAHNDRPYFWRRGGALEFYYGGVGAVTGALTRFPLDRLGNITGQISDMRSLTVNAGHGMNDIQAIVTTTGQIALYEGLDPGDPNDWRLLTRVQTGVPLGQRAYTKVASDVWMLTRKGLVSLTETIRMGRLAMVSQVTRPIEEAIRKRVLLGGVWQLHTAADGSMVIINQVVSNTAYQFIYRTESRAWSTASFPAQHWHNRGGEVYFTDLAGAVRRLDEDGGQAEVITAVWHSSWFRLPRAAGIARLTPTILAQGALTFRVAVLTDHDETAADLAEAWQTVTIQPDNPADVGGTVALNETLGCTAIGNVFQIRMEVTATRAQLVSMTFALH
ncbi:MAG: hypothetical protein AAF674_19760 [Pseudomonadota bacterium]